MRIKGSALIVILSLTGTALAMAFSGKEEASIDSVVAVAKTDLPPGNQGKDQAKLAQSESTFDLLSIKRKTPKPAKSSELFQSKSWYTAPPPPPVSTLPRPPPSAPQLSFTFSGRMIDGDQVILFLTKNGKQYTVKAGDVIDDTYRLEKVANTSAVLTYLPMNIQQTLTFNSTAIGALSANEPQKN